MPVKHDEELDFIDLFWLIWDSRWLVAGVTVICTVLALILALTATPLYRATVVLTEVQESGLDAGSGLAGEVGGLASLAGLALGENGQHPERQAVLRSRNVVDQFVRLSDVMPLLVAGETDPKKRSLWVTVERFRKSVLDIQQDKLKGTTTVTIDWKDPAVAARWGTEFVALTNTLLRDKAIADATRNVAFLQEQVEHASSVDLQKVMYRLIEQETRTLMLAKGRTEYAFTTVDPPVTAEVRISPRRTLLVLSGITVGVFLGSLIAWIRLRFRSRPRRRPAPGTIA